MDTLAQRFIAFLQARELPVRPGVSAEQIREFEHRYGVVLPADMRDYYLAVDGMEDIFSDEPMGFWPLSEVKPLGEEEGQYTEGNEGFFVIADYFISAHEYAIRLSARAPEGGAIIVWGEGPYRQVASSFEEFLARFLDDPDSPSGDSR
jgi:hypothetical protein